MNNVTHPRHRAVSQTAFIVVCALLLAAAITLNTATSALRLHFKKDPVPQPRDFHEIPQLMGEWLQISDDEKLDKETQDTLGTDKYVYRDYVQVDKYGGDFLVDLAGGEKLDDQQRGSISSSFVGKSFAQRVAMIEDAMKDKSSAERKAAMFTLQTAHPDGIMNVGLTYYTGLVDTVAHIPDRCYIADGYEPTSYTKPTWTLGKGSDGKDQTLEVRFISFEDQTGSNRVPKCVAYVFNVNGHYDSDPLGVRRSLQSLTQQYGYYAKIELMTLGNDTDMASAAMSNFLGASKPEIERCFPDWQKLTHTGK